MQNYKSVPLHYSHPKATGHGHVHEHILVAERALGKYLPKGAIVHHHDENKRNNKNNNLVICESISYHKLLHTRMRIINAGKDPNLFKQCSTCREILLLSEFGKNISTCDGYHYQCKKCRKIKVCKI